MDDKGEKDKRINPEDTTSNRTCRKKGRMVVMLLNNSRKYC